MSRAGTRQDRLRRARQDLSEAQNHRCAYCGVRLGDGNAPTLDHIQARAYGGLSTRQNMIVACADCNNARGTMNAGRFFRQINKVQAP